MNHILQAALKYASLEYVSVFPASVDHRSGATPKRPVYHGRRIHEYWNPDGTGGGLTSATRDPDAIRREWPARYYIGIAAVFDDLVLDLDEPDQLSPLLNTFPELDEAPRQRTPSGGAHIGPLRVPEGWPEIATGTWPKSAPSGEHLGELRGLGKAYILVAPSSINGKAYRWERPLPSRRDGLPEASPELLSYLTEPPKRARAPRRRRSGLHTTTAPQLVREVRYAEVALEREARELASMKPDSGRNIRLNAAAYSLGHKVASSHLERSHVEETLQAAAEACGLDTDPDCGPSGIRATIRSGLEAGMREPWPGLEPDDVASRYPRATPAASRAEEAS